MSFNFRGGLRAPSSAKKFTMARIIHSVQNTVRKPARRADKFIREIRATNANAKYLCAKTHPPGAAPTNCAPFAVHTHLSNAYILYSIYGLHVRYVYETHGHASVLHKY